MQLLWKGQEAFEAALDLIAAAEHASQQQSVHTEAASEQFVWRQDILRPAADSSQVGSFAQAARNRLLIKAAVLADCTQCLSHC